MFKRQLSVIAVSLIAASVIQLPAYGAGLGRLNVLSGLGQPLRAEIDLVSTTKEEASSISARLAPAEAFAQANLEYTPALSNIRFAVDRRANGQPFIRVSSTTPVNDPFLDILVELNWSSGRLVREYTFLLDPPDSNIAKNEPAAPIAIPSVSSTPRREVPNRETPNTSVRPSLANNPNASNASSERTAVPSQATARASSESAASNSDGAGGTYEVKAGDTLGKIARSNLAQGISLDQMLVALYRNNESAFDGNINRLKSGAILQLPTASVAQGVDQAEAKRVVSAQTADFAAYRDRLANAGTGTNATRTNEGSQATAGTLTAKVDERVGKSAESKDQLKLSKADERADSRNSGKEKGGRAGANAPSIEDLATKDRQLKEANSRVDQLEKNVANLQKLVELKNQNLAELQKQAQIKSNASNPALSPLASAPVNTSTKAAPPEMPRPIASSTPVTVAPPATTPPVAAAPVAPVTAASAPAQEAPRAETPSVTPSSAVAPEAVTPPAQPAAETQKIAPKKGPTAPPVAETSLLDELLATPLIWGVGLIVLLIVGYLIYNSRRKRRFAKFEDSILASNSGLTANSVFGTTGGQSVDTSSSTFNSNFVPMAGQAVDTNEVDAVAEADVYIAYGRDAQAEEILKEALRTQPERNAVRLKLLEIYAKRKDIKSFETGASELYALTSGQGEDWKVAAAMGISIDPKNPLYKDGDVTDLEGTQFSIRDPLTNDSQISPFTEPPVVTNMPVVPPVASITASTATRDMPEHTSTRPIPSGNTNNTNTGINSALDLDFDLGFNQQPVPPASVPSLPPTSNTTVTKTGGAGNSIDFDLDLPGASMAPAVAKPEKALDFSVAKTGKIDRSVSNSEIDFNLDLPSSSGAEEVAVAPKMTSHASDFPAMDHSMTATDPFGGINLNLDTHVGNSALTNGGVRMQEMATKLDLAAAYRDIGDKDGARELLQEVINYGDGPQVDKAKHLLEALN